MVKVTVQTGPPIGGRSQERPLWDGDGKCLRRAGIEAPELDPPVVLELDGDSRRPGLARGRTEGQGCGARLTVAGDGRTRGEQPWSRVADYLERQGLFRLVFATGVTPVAKLLTV